jgi:predicted RNA binding protein YcfA (HicA-like mRNA interferase family)
MTRLPRDLRGADLIRKPKSFGCESTRQTGSHVRLSRPVEDTQQQHPITIPKHKTLRIGTLSSILNDVALHLGKSKDELSKELFE